MAVRIDASKFYRRSPRRSTMSICIRVKTAAPKRIVKETRNITGMKVSAWVLRCGSSAANNRLGPRPECPSRRHLADLRHVLAGDRPCRGRRRRPAASQWWHARLAVSPPAAHAHRRRRHRRGLPAPFRYAGLRSLPPGTACARCAGRFPVILGGGHPKRCDGRQSFPVPARSLLAVVCVRAYEHA
jgi:hypothetical protein